MSNISSILAAASDRRQQGIPYPVRRETLDLPLDVANHFCNLDCSFDLRVRNIQRASESAVPEAAQAASRMLATLEGFQAKLDPLFLAYQQTEAAEYMIEASASRGVSLPEEQKDLRQLQSTILSNELITQTDQVIAAAEYMVGIRREPLPIPKEVLTACKAGGMDFDLAAYQKQLNQPVSQITSFPMIFDCMDVTHYMDAMRYSDPSRYAPNVWEVAPASLESYHQYVEQKALTCCQCDLAMYDQLDDAAVTTKAGGGKPVSREDLIYINGCSLRSLVDLSVSPEATPNERREAAASVLSEAVLNPQECYVEAFLPDNKNNGICTTPVPMTVHGENAQEMEAPKMNAWQRFWAKHGRYKDLAARLQRYETLQEYKRQTLETALPLVKEASDEWGKHAADEIHQMAAQKLQEASQTKDSIAVSLFGEEFLDPEAHAEMMPDTTSYRTGRAGVNLGICLLLQEDMSLEQIMDPEYKPAQKRELGFKLLDMAREDDPAAFCDFVLPAEQKILDMPNIDMDYSNPADILEHLEEIHLRSLTFDMFQETTVTRSPVYREVETRVGNMDQYQATLQAHGEFYNRLSHYASCLTDGESRVNRTPLTDPIKFANLATMAGFTQKYGAQLNAGMRPNELGDISREMIQMNFYAATAASFIFRHIAPCGYFSRFLLMQDSFLSSEYSSRSHIRKQCHPCSFLPYRFQVPPHPVPQRTVTHWGHLLKVDCRVSLHP